MSAIHRLSDAKVRTASVGRYCDGGGLYLRVEKGKHGPVRSWFFRWKKRYHGLGSVSTVSLAEAREAALACRKLVRDGGDPIAARKAKVAATHADAAKVMTFSEAAKRYIHAHSAGWRNPVHGRQWVSTLTTYAEPVLGKLPVQEIDTALVLKVVEPIWTKVPETASRVRGRIELVLNYAAVLGKRSGANPARWKGHLDHLLPPRSKVKPTEHHAALPYGEIGEFMTDLRSRDAVSALAMEIVILTALRTKEALGGCWGPEIDFAARTWTVPASRMKGGREHRVPLSDRVVEILQKLHEVRASDEARIFPGRGGHMGSSALQQLLRRMGREGEITVHGFRSSFRDWAAEQTAFPSDVCEMALAHAVSDKTEAAYKRTDLFEKRRRLMDAWAEFCAGPAQGKVSPIRAVS